MDAKILVIEDEFEIQEIIRAFLEESGYFVTTADDGLDGMEKFRKESFSLVILDIMLPKIDGFVVCEMIRNISKAPIILLTALDDESDQVKGFDLLADDYITKPFSLNLLLKRVEAVLRRSSIPENTDSNIPHKLLHYKNITLDKTSYKVFINKKTVDFTTKEFEVLAELLENKGRVLTRDTLLENLWGYNFFGDTRVVDTHIKNIRHKLGMDPIETIRGVGYRIDEEN